MRLGVEYDKSINHDDAVNNVFTYFSEDFTSNFKAIEQSVLERSSSLKEYISTQIVYLALMITYLRFYN